MSARLNLLDTPTVAKAMKHFGSASMVLIKESTLPAVTRDLVLLRASQINGCAHCTDVHGKDLLAAGQDTTRVNLVAAWREATVFTDAERAALELSEQGTRLADSSGGVTDEAWTNAANHYDEAQLAALVTLIAIINANNRLGVITRMQGGSYQPGQYGY
ncbi:carboxymuconolactone decarboxylase family protein [Dactylosporangium sp. CS-033363]|uniref:carboxymuconolactone decarboxylase family protein n=1 Tax=Dactylosporangium sp. CS-033363 TaxID=3239935 RepID=UPI003D8B7202